MYVYSENAGYKACEAEKKSVLFLNEYFGGKRNTTNGT